MSRAAKLTLLGAIVTSGVTVWGVHYMQVQEREVSVLSFVRRAALNLCPLLQTMHKGVERDQARQDEKKRQRAIDLKINQEKERQFQQMQPTKGWLQRIRGNDSNLLKEEGSAR
jgi:protein PET117